MGEVKRRWRDYRTAAGQRPVKKFLMGLPDEHRAAVADAMREVREKGERDGGARHLRRRIWEVRVDQGELTYRVLFASVGERGRILLSLEGFAKKTRKTLPATIDLAETRFKDWEQRGEVD
jgi:phage-related protein